MLLTLLRNALPPNQAGKHLPRILPEELLAPILTQSVQPTGGLSLIDRCHDGKQERADALVTSLPAESWGTLSCGAGSQGERLYDWACLQLPYDTVPGMREWLLVRRTRSEPTELAYFRAFGPEGTALAELVRVAGMRWAIEESFEDAKGSVGLDQYEVRKWTAWYRHVTLALLAHAYLEVTRWQATAGEKGGVPTSSR